MSTAERPRRAWLPEVWLAVVAACVAVPGVLDPGSYAGVIELQRQTWRAQDAVNLVAAVGLVLAARRASAGSPRAHLVRLGLLAWFAYCYLHLAFGARFGPLFLLYVAAAGLAGFRFLDGFVRTNLTRQTTPSRFPVRMVAIFLAVAGCGIAGLWLSEIVPGVLGLATPPNLHLGGLPNPTWVLDLGWLIPWSLATAWQLVRHHPAAHVNTVALLVLLATLSVAMLAVTPFALAAGLGPDPVAGPQIVAFGVVFGVLGVIEAAFLRLALAGSAGASGPILRASWWPQPADRLQAVPADPDATRVQAG